MKKVLSLLLVAAMIFCCISVVSAESVLPEKTAQNPSDTLRGFSYFYHNSQFMGGPYGWVSFAAGNPEGSSFISDFLEDGYVAGEFYDGYVYAYRYAEASSYYFCKVDAFTFEETIIAMNEDVADDMAYDYSTNTMYAIFNGTINTVDLETGLMTFVGDVGPDYMLALACSTDGVLYGVGDDGNLYSINKETGLGNLIGATGVVADNLQSMAWDHNTDTLYWASCATEPHILSYYTTDGALYEVDVESGAAEYIGNVYGSNMQITCLYAVPDFYDAPEYEVESMRLNLNVSYMLVGQTAQLSAYMEPNNAPRGVNWASSDPDIVSIDAGGLMTANALGTATITATTPDGMFTETCEVNVIESADGLTLEDAINGEGYDYTYSNDAAYPFTVEVRDGRLCAKSNMHANNANSLLQVDLGTLPGGTVVRFDWKTDTRYFYHGWILWFNDSYVANLTGATGWLTYEYVIPTTGEYVITWNCYCDSAPADGLDTCWVDNLQVITPSFQPVEGVNVTPETAEVYERAELQLTAEVYPAMVEDNSVTWESSDESVATVDDNGLVTAVAAGVAEITATTNDGGFTDSCLLTVNSADEIDNPISEALNVSGGTLVFENDPAYPWVVDSETYPERTAVKSTIEDIHSTNTYITLNAGYLNAGDRISFDWLASSEGGTWDYASFLVNGASEATMGGEENDWTTYTYTVPEAGEYVFTWRYQKDSSVSRGSDCVWIDNVQLFTENEFIPGDVDGDGIVDSLDALLILRYAMGIIGEEALNIENADVNEDGTIDALDALFVLRMSLNV